MICGSVKRAGGLAACFWAKAAVNVPPSRRFARLADEWQSRQRLDCGTFSTAFCRTRAFVDGWTSRAGKAAEGRTQSKTLSRGPMILKMRGASWSAPALWRFSDLTR